MGLPGARIGDPTVHGGVVSIGMPTVLVGGMPAARIGDLHTCPMVTGLVPHVGGPICLGAFTVLIGNMPAARQTDMAVCVGPPDSVAMGAPTVLIGMTGAGGAMGIIKGLFLAGKAIVQQAIGGRYPRAVLTGDGQFATEYSKNVRLSGTPEEMARNIAQLNAIREGPGGEAFLSSLDDRDAPVTVNVIGDPARAKAIHPGQQSYQNCAVQSAQQIIHQATGIDNSEATMERIANNPTNSGYSRNGGTPAGNEEIILENSGVPAHTEPGSTASVDRALANGQGVISEHDAGSLWNNPAYARGGHAVHTTGAIQDDQGNTLAYVINDTGTNQAGRTLPAAEYGASMLGTPIIVTDDPIW